MLAIYDMLFLVGSSITTATILEPEPKEVSDERPLYRTGQLLVSVALVILRQMIYQTKVESGGKSELPCKCLIFAISFSLQHGSV